MTGRSTEEPSVSWADWYSACLEAGGPLRTRAEVVYFARKAKERLEVDQVRAEDDFLPRARRRRGFTEYLRVQKAAIGEALHADHVVDLLLKRAAAAFARILARAH